MEQITLKQARNLKGLSRKYVSAEMHKNPATILNWEKGKSSPNAKEFMALCNLYGVSPMDIFLPEE